MQVFNAIVWAVRGFLSVGIQMQNITCAFGLKPPLSQMAFDWCVVGLLMCYSKVWGGYECMVTRPDATLDTTVRQCSLLSAGLTFSAPML
jgi:hypothetical protein